MQSREFRQRCVAWLSIGAVLAFLGLVLAGCAALGIGPSPGLTAVSMAPDGSFEYESGKEYAEISGSFVKPDGSHGEFMAKGVEAFPGQTILLEMQKNLTDLVKIVAGMAGPMLRPAVPDSAVQYDRPPVVIDSHGVQRLQ